MLKILRKRFASSLFMQKLLWTLLIVFVYMVGRTLPIATVRANAELFNNEKLKTLMDNLSAVSGGQLSSFTLFSLGLGPYMTAMILLRTLVVFDVSAITEMTTERRNRFQMALALLIAFIQAFGMTVSTEHSNVSATGFYTVEVAQAVTIVLLMTGAVVLIWLANMNSAKGIGGAIVIILTNMIISFIGNIITYAKQTDWTILSVAIQLLIFVVTFTLLVMIAIITYRGEYRIPIKRVNLPLQSSLASAYIPIRLNPAGAMPFMYGITMMTLPSLLFSGLASIFPNVTAFTFLAVNTSIRTLSGVLCYIVILYILAIGFAYYNYDADDISKNMRNNGDYIEGIRPGIATRKYLQHYISIFAQIGALIVCILGGVPMLANVTSTEQVSLALLVTNVYIIASFMLGLIEQVESLRLWKKYDKLL